MRTLFYIDPVKNWFHFFSGIIQKLYSGIIQNIYSGKSPIYELFPEAKFNDIQENLLLQKY